MRAGGGVPVVPLCFTTEAAEGDRGGWWVGEQANFLRPSGTLQDSRSSAGVVRYEDLIKRLVGTPG